MEGETTQRRLPERYRIADLALDVDACTLTRDDTAIALPPRTFELLVALVRRFPNVARREDLIESLWHGESVLDEVLSQRVMLLRRALGDTAERPRYIALVRKWGYKVVAPVQRLTDAPTATARGDDGGLPGVAVLPFVDMSPGRDQEYLCEGISEEIINALTKLAGVRVIARTSSFAIGRMGLDIREAGARLGVGTILEGSVRRDGSRVRVTAQLISTGDGSHLWSDTYDRELTDVLALEDDIASAIAAGLRGRLDPAPRPARRRVDADAYAAFLEGRHHFARANPEALARAAACYQRALATDDDFALAWDSLAELHWYLGFFGHVSPRDAFSQSTWCALRALELDDSLAQTHALLAMLRKELDYNWPEVDRELARALDLERGSPQVQLRYAISGLLPHGRVEDASAVVEAVLRDDPLSLIVLWWAALMAYLARRPERTLAAGRQMIALDDRHFLGYWTLGVGLTETGPEDEAVAAFERAHELSGGAPFTLGFLAFGAGRAGRTDEARRLLETAHAMAAATFMPPMTVAMCHVGLGEWEAVLDWLARAIDGRDPIIMPIRTFPFLDPVRNDSRFARLLAAMHLA